MKPRTKTLTAVAVVAALAGTTVAGASLADHRGGGMGLPGAGPLGLDSAETFAAADADGDGLLTQAEIDRLAGERLAAHDANGDGTLSLEEFAALWNEVTRPVTVRAFQALDADGDAVVTRAEYERAVAGIVRRLDEDGDGAFSLGDRWHDDDDDRRNDGDGRWWDRD